MSAERDVEIVVVGGGLVGATAACLLAKQGRQLVLLDRQRPAIWDAQAAGDLRVFAISPGSAQVLVACDVWDFISSVRASVYQNMEVTTAAGGLMRFQAHEHGLAQLGWIIENRLIQSQLWTQLEQQVELIAPAEIVRVESGKRHAQLELADGTRLRTRLLLAADGARSFVREQLGMTTSTRDYQQRALVAELDTEIPNDGTAWQIFLDSGPLAFLPLSDGRSSMVWSLPADQAEMASQWSVDKLAAELTLVSNGRFGAVSVASDVVSFPLHLLLAKAMRQGRVVLLGDAAHQAHPLAGQGVNMGFQDAAALAQCLSDIDLKDMDATDTALSRFERWRISENTLMTRGIDGIQRLFAKQPGIAGLGLSMVQSLWPVKDRFIQHACGTHPNAPDICRR